MNKTLNKYLNVSGYLCLGISFLTGLEAINKGEEIINNINPSSGDLSELIFLSGLSGLTYLIASQNKKNKEKNLMQYQHWHNKAEISESAIKNKKELKESGLAKRICNGFGDGLINSVNKTFQPVINYLTKNNIQSKSINDNLNYTHSNNKIPYVIGKITGKSLMLVDGIMLISKIN